MSRVFGVVLWAAGASPWRSSSCPIAAIFLRVPPGDLLDALGSPVARDALRVTLATTLAAQAVILLVGTPAAYLLATRRFRGRSLVVTLVELPLVLPPAVAGIGLLAAFGRFGLLGDTCRSSVSRSRSRGSRSSSRSCSSPGPFFVRTAIAAFEAVDPTLVDASRTLGAGPVATFARVALPLASGGLGAGAALAFARGLGEFGATIMFAGSLQGVTQTLSLAVYEQFDVDFDTALAIGAELVAASAALLLAVKLIPSWRPSTQSFPTPFRSFDLELTLDVGADPRARRAVRSGQVERPPGGRGPPAPGSGAHRARRRDLARHDARDRRRSGAPLGWPRLPGLRAVPAPQRPPQRRLRSPGPRRGRRAAGAVPDRSARRRAAGGDLRG